MLHRVYICANLNCSFVVQDCNQLSGSDTIDIHTPSILILPFVSTNLLQDSIDKAHVDSIKEPTGSVLSTIGAEDGFSFKKGRMMRARHLRI